MQERSVGRIPNRVLQSRNPEGYFWHPFPKHAFNPESGPDFALKSRIPNPELQIREIPDPEKSRPSAGTSPFKQLKMNVPKCCYHLLRRLAQPRCDTGSAGLTYVVGRGIGANQKQRNILSEQ